MATNREEKAAEFQEKVRHRIMTSSSKAAQKSFINTMVKNALIQKSEKRGVKCYKCDFYSRGYCEYNQIQISKSESTSMACEGFEKRVEERVKKAGT